MKVVFLCGGVGKRMFPITEDKFLLKFLGKPLLAHQIEMVANVGLADFEFICNPQNMEKISAVAAGYPGIDASFVRLQVENPALYQQALDYLLEADVGSSSEELP